MFVVLRETFQSLLCGSIVLFCLGAQAQASFFTVVHVAVPHDVRMVVEGLGDRVSKHGMRRRELELQTNALFESSCVPVVCTPETDARLFNFQRNFLLDACHSNTCPAVMPPRLRVRLEKATDARQVLCSFDLSWTLIKHHEGVFAQFQTPQLNIRTPEVECQMSKQPLQIRRAGGGPMPEELREAIQFSVFPRQVGSTGGGAAQ